MSVPLERLYHYLDDCVNHDLVIYRWTPHGSRKLEDLKELTSYTDYEFENLPVLILHDQEPLNYNLWSRNDFKDRVSVLFSNFLKNNSLDCNNKILEYFSHQHLRSLAIMCENQHDLTILVHSEQRSPEINLFANNNFVPVYYWSHGLIAQDWFRYAKHDPKLNYNLQSIQFDFLVYNRAWSGTREYRLDFSNQLAQENLIPCCNTKFNPVDQEVHYTCHEFQNKNFAINNSQLEQHFVLNSHLPDSSADYCNDDYSTSAIEVVLETLFDDTRLHLTEKTLRPIACGKPFILASTAGSLQYLKTYGFETFAGLIDESYDNISNSKMRLDAIIREMKRISSLGSIEKQQLYSKMHVIAQRNKHRFFNGLSDQIMQEYQINMTDSLNIVKNHCTNRHRTAIRQLLQQN